MAEDEGFYVNPFNGRLMSVTSLVIIALRHRLIIQHRFIRVFISPCVLFQLMN